MRLTKVMIDKATYNGGWDVRWDNEITGFGLRLYPSGKKSFVLSYRNNGRKRLYVLGQYGHLTLDDARKLAKKRLYELDGGTDPIDEKRSIAQEKTVAELAHFYIERHAKLHKKTWTQDQYRIDTHILPAWRTRQVKSITKIDVGDLFHKVSSRGIYEANRTLSLISKMFECAIDWGFVDENFMNPTLRIKKFKEEKRDRWVTHEELPKLMEAIEQEPHLYAREAIRMYLFTGTRKSELLRIKWDDINWQRKEVVLKDTKNGKTHYIPLSKAAIETLQQLPRVENNPFVFCGKKQGQHLVNIEKPWRRIRKAAGLSDVRLHDLRRTVGSYLAQSGNSLHLIGKILNHSDTSTTAIYARFGEDHARAALEQHSRYINSINNS